MERALAYRNKYFRIPVVVAVVSIALALLAGDAFEGADSPDALTYGVLAFSLVSTVFFAFYAFDASRIRARLDDATHTHAESPMSNVERLAPRRLRTSSILSPQAPPRSLEEMGRSLAALAMSLILQPILLGFVVFTISGDLWRQLLFLPVAALVGALYWRRIETALAGLNESGVTKSR